MVIFSLEPWVIAVNLAVVTVASACLGYVIARVRQEREERAEARTGPDSGSG
jgi:hypothetical protein